MSIRRVLKGFNVAERASELRDRSLNERIS
jgi:hypothetical protein